MLTSRFSCLNVLIAVLILISSLSTTPCIAISSSRDFLVQQLLEPSDSLGSVEVVDLTPSEMPPLETSLSHATRVSGTAQPSPTEIAHSAHGTTSLPTTTTLFAQSPHSPEKVSAVVITETPTVHSDVTAPTPLGRVPVAHEMGAAIEPVLEVHPETITLTPSRSSDVTAF